MRMSDHCAIFVTLLSTSCSSGRSSCNSQPGPVADPWPSPAESVRPCSKFDGSPGPSTISRNGNGDLDDSSLVCDLIAERLELVARWRYRPRELFAGKGLSCGEPENPLVCGGYKIDEGGFTGVSFPENGPGAFFHFELREEPTRTRVSCRTLGLRNTVQDLSEPGVERCETIRGGPIDGMTVIVDCRCDRLRITVFDDEYLRSDAKAGTLTPCDKTVPDRQAAPVLVCPFLGLL